MPPVSPFLQPLGLQFKHHWYTEAPFYSGATHKTSHTLTLAHPHTICCPRQSLSCLLIQHSKWHMTEQWSSSVIYDFTHRIVDSAWSIQDNVNNKPNNLGSQLCMKGDSAAWNTGSLRRETSLYLPLPASVFSRYLPSSHLHTLLLCWARWKACPKTVPQVGEGEFKLRLGLPLLHFHMIRRF